MSDERDLSHEWIPVAEAAAMLGGTDEDVRRLVRMRRLRWREVDETICLDDVVTVLELREFDTVLDGGGSEKEARRRAEAVRARWEAGSGRQEAGRSSERENGSSQALGPVAGLGTLGEGETRAIENWKLQIENCKLIEGQKAISVRDAAAMLGVVCGTVCGLIRSGRFSWCEKLGQKRYVLLSEVESYARLRDKWDGLPGKWSPYGLKREGRHCNLDVAARADGRFGHPKGPGPSERDGAGDVWITAREAASILEVQEPQFDRMARGGILTRRKEVRTMRCGSPLRACSREVYVYSLLEVTQLSVERGARRKTIPAGQWNRDLQRPVMRTDMTAAPGDCLISRRDAASILEVCPSFVSGLVDRGRLFGWQRLPGKCGSRLLLSFNQVMRYRNEPQRLERRACRLGARSGETRDGGDWPPLYPRTEGEAFRMEKGLTPTDRGADSLFSRRDFGEFFSSRQTARMLGVSLETVRDLRKGGRLSGYQRPRTKADGGGKKWWFYRKDDVYNLMADSDYIKRHRRSKGVWESRDTHCT